MLQNKILYYPLTFLISLFFLSSITYATDTKKEISLTNGEWAPFLSEKLPDHGFASAVVETAFAAVNYQVNWNFLPWKRAYSLSQRGEKDGSVLWVKTKEREKDFLYSDPVIIDNEYVYSHVDSPIHWNLVEDLHGYRLALTLHAVYPAIEDEITAGFIFADRNGGYDKLLPRLVHKRADGAVLTDMVASYFMRQNPDLIPHIYRDSTILYHREYSLIISRKAPNAKHIINDFNNGLKMIKKDGTYKKLLQKLSSGYFDSPDH